MNSIRSIHYQCYQPGM